MASSQSSASHSLPRPCVEDAQDRSQTNQAGGVSNTFAVATESTYRQERLSSFPQYSSNRHRGQLDFLVNKQQISVDNFRNSFAPQRNDSLAGNDNSSLETRGVKRHRNETRQEAIATSIDRIGSSDEGGRGNTVGRSTAPKPVWRRCRVCQKKATIMCQQCESVFYCSQSCWEIHKPSHDPVCNVPKSSKRRRKGKHDQASPIWSGESSPVASSGVLQTPSEPAGISKEEGGCNFCGSSPAFTCAGWADVKYCSHECRIFDLADYEQICDSLRGSAASTESDICSNNYADNEAQAGNGLEQYLYNSIQAPLTSNGYLAEPQRLDTLDSQIVPNQHEDYHCLSQPPLQAHTQPPSAPYFRPVRHPMTLAEYRAAVRLHVRRELEQDGEESDNLFASLQPPEHL